MANYERNKKFLHPLLELYLPQVLAAIEKKLPAGWKAKLISGHRTPDDQFIIYKKGREFKNGNWRKVGVTFTNIDGFTQLSQHNYLPALSFDVGLFRIDGSYEPEKHYAKIGSVAKKYKFDWGGNWKKFKDQPHIEIPASRLFKKSPVRDVALQWQKYLMHAGAYEGKLDGMFGPKSRTALKEVTGSEMQDIKTWETLYKKFGPIHKMKDFNNIPYIPVIN